MEEYGIMYNAIPKFRNQSEYKNWRKRCLSDIVKHEKRQAKVIELLCKMEVYGIICDLYPKINS